MIRLGSDKDNSSVPGSANGLASRWKRLNMVFRQQWSNPSQIKRQISSVSSPCKKRGNQLKLLFSSPPPSPKGESQLIKVWRRSPCYLFLFIALFFLDHHTGKPTFILVDSFPVFSRSEAGYDFVHHHLSNFGPSFSFFFIFPSNRTYLL